MEKLSEYLQRVVPDLSLDDYKRVIKAYKEFDRKNHDAYCHICLKPISIKEQQELSFTRSPMDYTFTCKEHIQYRTVVNIPMIQKELGIKVDEQYLFDI